MNQVLYLAPHVRAASHEGQVILLDLLHNRYLGVAGAQSGALAKVVSGWPIAADTLKNSSMAADVQALTAQLLRQGLLTSTQPASTVDLHLPEPAQSLDADDVMGGAGAGYARIFRLVRTSTFVSVWLRWRSLQSIAQGVASRRLQGNASSIRPTRQPLRMTVAAYLRLRPLLFTAHDRCLHESLSLLGFLAAEGWFPNWVIGVATQPFRAHAWVQSGDLVLSDLHENVRRYTPILVA